MLAGSRAPCTVLVADFHIARTAVGMTKFVAKFVIFLSKSKILTMAVGFVALDVASITCCTGPLRAPNGISINTQIANLSLTVVTPFSTLHTSVAVACPHTSVGTGLDIIPVEH